MLAASYFSPVTYSHSTFSPPQSLPRAERSADATPQFFHFAMPLQPIERKAISQRAYKPNPVIQSRDATAQSRRSNFFRRVQNGRDDKQWAARGEQIQRSDYMSERKRWEEEKVRQAPPETEIFDDECIEDEALPLVPCRVPAHQEESEADHFAAQEECELQQLISMEQESNAESQHFGSDDFDYDSIFMECEAASNISYHSQTNLCVFDVDTMDVDQAGE